MSKYTPKPRSAPAVAAQNRKAGPHSGRRKPQPSMMSILEEYLEETAQALATLPFDLGDTVEVVDYASPFFGERGAVVTVVDERIEDTRFGVAFPWDPASRPQYFRAHQLERKGTP